MRTIVFDIETGPLPEAELALLEPAFEAGKNLKDPEKIRADLEAKREAWREGAALSAVTGQVIALGLFRDGAFEAVTGEERAILQRFWSEWMDSRTVQARFVGFNILGFDLPFLIRRSWHHRLPVPDDLRQNGRYWHPRFIDLREIWQLGDRQAAGKLDDLARHLNAGSKNGSGADFARLLVHDRERALAYLENDVRLTAAVHEVLCAADTY